MLNATYYFHRNRNMNYEARNVTKTIRHHPPYMFYLWCSGERKRTCSTVVFWCQQTKKKQMWKCCGTGLGVVQTYIACYVVTFLLSIRLRQFNYS